MNLNEREEYLSMFDQFQNFLSQSQRQAFHLHYIEDLSLSEIAQILATTRQAVSDAINKAKKNLMNYKNKLL